MLQAAEAFDRFLARTCMVVRIHTTAEICEVLDRYLKRDHSSRALHAIERFALAKADRLIWEGGDVLGTPISASMAPSAGAGGSDSLSVSGPRVARRTGRRLRCRQPDEDPVRGPAGAPQGDPEPRPGDDGAASGTTSA